MIINVPFTSTMDSIFECSGQSENLLHLFPPKYLSRAVSQAFPRLYIQE